MALTKVIRHLAPVAPSGCPMAIAPACGLNDSSGIPYEPLIAHEADAKASLCSRMSTSSNLIPVTFYNFLTVGIGADITLLDSTPDVA